MSFVNYDYLTMKVSVPISELDEALLILAGNKFGLEHGTSKATFFESVIQKLRQGVIKFSDQHISAPVVGDLDLLKVDSRSLTIRYVTRQQKLAEHYLSGIDFLTYQLDPDSSQNSGCANWFSQLLRPVSFLLVINFDAIPKVKELMDQWRFSLTDVRINSEEITLVGAIRQD